MRFRVERAPRTARAMRAAERLAYAAVVGACALVSGSASEANDASGILANVSRALADPGSAPLRDVAVVGSVAGGGEVGTFRTWTSGDRERADQTLGPRTEKTLRLGDRRFVADENGFVRELTGSIARRERTQEFVDSGAFAEHPERCLVRGFTREDGRTTLALDVTAPGGATERLELDPKTWLPARIVYDDDDGRSSIVLSDWRTIAGHRFPFLGIASNGDRAFDVRQTTQSVDAASAIDPTTFAPFPARTATLDAPETIPLVARDGHLFAPVTIGDRAYEFLVDSGAQNVVVDRVVANELGLVSSGAFEASGARRTGGVGLATVPSLVVGTRGRVGSLVVATLDLHDVVGKRRIDGILGYPLFASFAVRIDAAGRTMTLGAPGSLADVGTRVPLDVDRALAEVTLRLDKRFDAPFIVDTGNASSLLLYRPFVARHPQVVAYTTNARNSVGVGGRAASYRTSLAELDVAGVPFYNVDTDVMLATSGAFADRTDAGNVGLGLLGNLVVTFDESSAALYVGRGSAYDDGSARN